MSSRRQSSFIGRRGLLEREVQIKAGHLYARALPQLSYVRGAVPFRAKWKLLFGETTICLYLRYLT